MGPNGLNALPDLTGTPLIVGWKPEVWIKQLENRWSDFMIKVQKAQFLPVKTTRLGTSFMVSKFDHVASGFPLEGEWLFGLQKHPTSTFCGMFGLSDHMAHLFLYQPLKRGGLRCPLLEVRASVRFLKNVLGLEYGRSGLGKAAWREIWRDTAPGYDVLHCRRLLEVYDIGMLEPRR